MDLDGALLKEKPMCRLAHRRDSMESSCGEKTLADLPDDTLSCVLSFLRSADVRACAGVCRRLREVCRQEGSVWRAVCERRWGSLTSPSLWGHGRIPFSFLYATLDRWEHVIGFWRGVGNGFLALFEWGPDCIVGYRVVPAGTGSYAVRKLAVLWMTLSEDGQVTCLLDPMFKTMGASHCKLQSSVETTARLGSSSAAANVKLKDMLALGMVLVDVHFVGYHHLVIEEVMKTSSCIANELAEAAASAALGYSHDSLERSPPSWRAHQQSNGQNSYSSSSDTDSCAGSPPGSFQHEMYHFLTTKVTSGRGDRAARKQKRRVRERGISLGRSVLKPEHFVKVTNSSPTKARPLQGLWKGFFERVGLGFVLISYDDKDGIVCRRVQELDGTLKCGSVLWMSEPATRAAIPYCVSEEALYSSRTHTRSGCSVGQLQEANEVPFDFCSNVISILCTSSWDAHSMSDSHFREGRVWQYADGTFGFGYCQSNSVVDFRALCSEDCLLDSVD